MSIDEPDIDLDGCGGNAAPYVLGALTDEEHEEFVPPHGLLRGLPRGGRGAAGGRGESAGGRAAGECAARAQAAPDGDGPPGGEPLGATAAAERPQGRSPRRALGWRPALGACRGRRSWHCWR